MKTDPRPIIVSQSFKASADTVWNAITDLQQMRQWYFPNIPAFDPVVGFETQFDVESNGRHFLHQWKITELLPGKKIAYSWRYPDFEGDALVEFEIFPHGHGCQLTLHCYGIESFPQHIPEFKRESCMAGWDYFIRKNLKSFLEP